MRAIPYRLLHQLEFKYGSISGKTLKREINIAPMENGESKHIKN